jgi:1,5-anhydro-D-fructose reductase (1,5-anhydro-D-mannitol-forming)
VSETKPPLRWGLIGLGWVAADFMLPAIAQNPGSKVLACLGSSEEKSRAFAARFKLERAYASLDAMMADRDIDAVYVATPNAIHREAVEAAARAGKHVLCEKPFSMTIDDAQAMTEACKRAGVVLRVAHQMRCEEVLARARDIVRSGRLGKIAAISLERASANPPRTTWRKDVTQSGVVFDVGVHLLDQIQWIAGEHFVEVMAFTYPDRARGEPDNQITVLGRLEGEGHATVRATREVASAENNLIVEGSEATLITSPLRFVAEHWLRVRDKSETAEERFPASPAYAWEVRAFEDDVHGKRSVLPTGEEGTQLVAVTRAVLDSVQQRRTVAVAQGSSSG